MTTDAWKASKTARNSQKQPKTTKNNQKQPKLAVKRAVTHSKFEWAKHPITTNTKITHTRYMTAATHPETPKNTQKHPKTPKNTQKNWAPGKFFMEIRLFGSLKFGSVLVGGNGSLPRTDFRKF